MTQTEFDELDSLAEQAHARRQQIDGELAQMRLQTQGRTEIPEDMIAKASVLRAERNRIDHGLQQLVNSPHVPYGYIDHYNEKYMTPKQPAAPVEPEGPGMLDRIFTGVKDTAKFAIQHPQRAAAHANLGVQEFASLPFRAIEGLLDKNVFNVRPGMESRQKEVAAADQAAGVDPRGTGPVVSEAVGQALVPLPLAVKPAEKLLSLRTAGNFAKGAGMGGALYGMERTAHDEPVDDGGLATSAGLTGLLSAVSGRMAGRGAGAPPPASPAAPTEPAGTAKLLEHKPPIMQGEVRGLPEPEPPQPSRFRDVIQSIRQKTQAGQPLDDTEKRFLLWYRQNKSTPPPNAAGAKDAPGVVPTREMKRQPDGSWKPLDEVVPPKAKGVAPNVIPGTPKAKAADVPKAAAGPPKVTPLESVFAKEQPAPTSPLAEAARGIEAEKAARLTAGKTAENKPLAKPPTEKVLPTKGILDEVKKIEDEVSKASQEALLGKVIKGEVNVKDVPIKRKPKLPKSEAPAPAVKGEVGVLPKDLAEIPFARENYKQHIDAGYSHKEAIAGVRANLKGMGGFEEHEIPDSIISPKAKTGLEAGKKAAEKKVESVNLRMDPNTINVKPTSVGKIAKTSEVKKPKVEELYSKLQAEGKTPGQAKELAEFKTDTRLSPAAEKPPTEIQLEKFIADKGYKVEVKEPFPGQKSYNVIDPKTGNTIARGDRDSVLNAMQVRNEGKGIKLRSGVGPEDVSEFAESVKKRLGWGTPKDVEIENNPHRDKFLNFIMREAGLETPDFAVRRSKSGTDITNAARHYEDAWRTRVNDLLYKEKEGAFTTTKLFDYFSADQRDQALVNRVLVLGDKLGTEYTSEQLAKQGLSTQQIRMYEGVREALKDAVGWIKEFPGHEAFSSKHAGYIPRDFFGDIEIFINGKKYVPTKMTELGEQELGSTFNTLREATKKVWELKDKFPDAKFSIKFHQDPNYVPSRGFADYRAVAAAKKNIEEIGKLSDAEIAEAFKISKSMKSFMRHLEERTGEKGYETENIQKVLGTYFVQGARTIERNHLKTKVGEILAKEGVDLTPGQVRYLNEYVDRVAGKPTWDELVAKHLIRDTVVGKWLDPLTQGTAIQTAKDWITYSRLGFGNVSWALLNLDSVTRHVWPMLQAEASKSMGKLASEKYLGIGLSEFFKNQGLRQKLAHHGVIDIQMMSEVRPDILHSHAFGKGQWTPSNVIMILGKWTEEFTRGVAAIARYRMALDQGMNDAAAMQAASKFVAETVGRYSRAGKPPAFTGGVGGVLGMFKTYPVVMLQNMVRAFESKDAGVITRYMLAALGASGVIGAMPGSEEVDKLASRYMGFSPIQWGYEHIPHSILTGIGSIAPEGYDVDFSRKAGLPDVFPNETSDLMGPVINTYATALAELLNGKYGDAALDLAPTSIRNIYAANAKPGYVMGKSGKPSAELGDTAGQRFKRGLGFQSNKEVWSSRAYQATENIEQYQNANKRSLAAKIVDGTATHKEREEFARLGGTNRMLREEHIRRNSTTLERQRRGNPRNLQELFQYQE